jgi:hypothetical protein
MENTMDKINESKNKTLSKLGVILDAYYQKYEEAGKKKDLTINHVERFLLDCKGDVDKVLAEASSDLLRGMESGLVEKKVYAQDVKGE